MNFIRSGFTWLLPSWYSKHGPLEEADAPAPVTPVQTPPSSPAPMQTPTILLPDPDEDEPPHGSQDVSQTILWRATIWLSHFISQAVLRRPANPALAAIRGNASPTGARRTPLRSTLSNLTGFPLLTSDDVYRVFMLQYLADMFGPETKSTDVGLDMRGLGEGVDIDPTRALDISDALPETNGLAAAPRISAEDGTILESIMTQSPRQLSPARPASDKDSLTLSPQLSRKDTMPKDERRIPSMTTEYDNLTLKDVRGKLEPHDQCDWVFFQGCNRAFMSDAEVWRYMKLSRVYAILGLCGLDIGESEREELAQTICGMPLHKKDVDFVSYRKVFSILILIKKPECIVHFVKEQLHDSLLPLPRYNDTCNVPRFRLRDSPTCHVCFDDWDLSELNLFETYQRQFCAPYFQRMEDGKCRHYVFPNNVAIPFKILSGAEIREGGNASVLNVELPRDHGNLNPHVTGNPKAGALFAVKKLRESDRKAFQTEANVLGRLNRTNVKMHPTPHLSVLSATFEVEGMTGPVFYFLFPSARFNLAEFWDSQSGYSNVARVQNYGAWMARQMKGLCQALSVLHNYMLWRRDSDEDDRNRGIHGDIKPQNILFFPRWEGYEDDIGILQLADFGASQYRHTVTLNQVTPAVKSHAYSPPEVELVRKTGQSLDIWALGCLFLDFSIWLTFGQTGVNKFSEARMHKGLHAQMERNTFYIRRRARKYFILDVLNVLVHPKVDEWIEDVHRNPAASQFVHDLVDIIQEEMLVVYCRPSDAPSDQDDISSQDEEQGFLRRNVTKLLSSATSNKERIKIEALEDMLDARTKGKSRNSQYFTKGSPYTRQLPQRRSGLYLYETDAEVRDRRLADARRSRAKQLARLRENASSISGISADYDTQTISDMATSISFEPGDVHQPRVGGAEDNVYSHVDEEAVRTTQ